VTAAAYSTALADIFTDGTTTGWAALGGGAAGLNQETDYFIQNTSMLSKNAFASATKGMIYNSGADSGGSGVDGAFLFWLTHAAPNSLAVKASGGMQALVGSATGAYEHYYVGGSDTMVFMGWELCAISETIAGDATTGTPSATVESHFGALWNLPTGGPTKGAPNAIDAIRFGRCDATVEHGTGADPEANFDGVVSNLDSIANRYGLMSQPKPNGPFDNSGLLLIGTATNPCEFKDSNKTIFLRAHDHVTANFHTWELRNVSSIFTLDNVAVKALGTASRGRFVHTDNGVVAWTTCSFTDMGTFQFKSNAVIDRSTFLNCRAISHEGGNLSGSIVTDTNVAADASALVYDVAADPDGEMDGMRFEMGTTLTHAIEFGLNSPLTMTLRGIDFAGYNVANALSDSTLHIKRTVGTVTINIIGGSGTVSYKTDGATVVIVQNPVTLKAIVTDPDGALITDSTIRVLVEAAAGGPLAAGTDIISAATDINGEVANTQTYATDQPIIGWARKSADAPNYKQFPISGTINKDNGLTLNIKMVPE